jgi:protein-tyrosine-phosphatase
MKLRVLFLCTTNGVESPMAEALLNRLDREHFEVMSAGIDPGEIHPLTLEVMKDIGIDLGGRVVKATRDVLSFSFDFVITLSDRAKSECPRFPEAQLVHWQFDDPLAELDAAKWQRLFRSLRDQIAQRVRLFVLVQARFAVDTHAHQDRQSQPHLVHF